MTPNPRDWKPRAKTTTKKKKNVEKFLPVTFPKRKKPNKKKKNKTEEARRTQII